VTDPLSWLLYALLAAAILPVIVRAAMYFPIILLFGMDAPGTNPLTYLFVASVPILAIIAVMAGAWFALRLWRSEDWRLSSFVVALALCWASWFVYLKTVPR
jgi:hypothetical protein